jgi:hypothetical protein
VRVGDLGLGWRSHLLACGFDAQIEEHDDCVALRTWASRLSGEAVA